MSLVRHTTWVAIVLLVALAMPSSAEDEFRIEVPVDDLDAYMYDDFGRRVKGRVHEGIDILAPIGTPVVAVADGVVTVARYDERPGWYLAVEHDNGWRSLYLHLDGAKPRWDGDQRGAYTAFAEAIGVDVEVSAGQVIGYVGHSGTAEIATPHTHFELRKFGRLVDPYPLVEDALRAARIEDEIERGVSPFR